MMTDFFSSLRGLTLAALSIVALGDARIQAQELDRVMPEPTPKLVEPFGQEADFEDWEAFRTRMIGATEGEKVLVPELKQIIFLEDSDQVDTVELPEDRHSNLAELPGLNSEGLQSLVDIFVGLPVSKESLERLRVSLRLVLAEEGKPFSLVFTPPQDITNGVVQFVIRESTVGQVSIENREFFSERSYLGRLGLSPGEGLDSGRIRTGLDRINSNPFRTAAFQVEKGAEPATTDVVLRVRERRPWRVFAGYNNSGTQTTTEDRMFAGLTLGNVWGMAHQLTLQATSDFDIEHSKAVSGNYRMDLPGNHELFFFGAYSEIKGVPNGGFDQEGTSWQLGFNYTIPLESQGDYSHRLTLGFDYKSSDNNLELSLPPFIIPISDTLTRIAQVRAEYRGALKDDWGDTRFGLGITYSPGGLGSKNDDDAFEASRFQADSEYAYLSLDGSRTIELGMLAEALAGWTWQLRSSLQLSNRNLLSSEQYAGGGFGSVRGYEQGEVVGDNAFFISQEWQLPVIPTQVSLPGYKETGLLRPFVFQDYARTWNTDKLPDEEAFNLHSYGVGLRYQVARNLTLDLAHGWQLRDSGSSNTGDNYRTNVSLRLAY
ncbi:hypothetical protein DDZ13_01785 [Coraliomargarita sinensis]|uniref:Haemolysin activator HlyB C-terminal domain-containing protein n=1 Tax=Coraliomargarita sinensis TaxID=2174842 RepID=A0A317ZP44_9BACT|nr:ShlB/FhaC/HecB family hemolysin secretion/activation protein [Coraliomargarita sinensis]PXA05629.1 hypothetical protein DDZ13_01785 [Coraliomargarita sinensis]